MRCFLTSHWEIFSPLLTQSSLRRITVRETIDIIIAFKLQMIQTWARKDVKHELSCVKLPLAFSIVGTSLHSATLCFMMQWYSLESTLAAPSLRLYSHFSFHYLSRLVHKTLQWLNWDSSRNFITLWRFEIYCTEYILKDNWKDHMLMFFLQLSIETSFVFHSLIGLCWHPVRKKKATSKRY